MEENGLLDPEVIAQGFRLFGCLTRYEFDPEVEDEMVEKYVMTETNMERLQLLVKESDALQTGLGVDPFEFVQDLARQQLAGRPLSTRILSEKGEILLYPNRREQFWNG